MQSGYYDATGAMVTQFNRLDIISNNLANLNTDGFKRDDVIIGDFERLFDIAHETLPIKGQTRKAAKYINHQLDRVPIIAAEYTSLTKGPMAKTDNTLDFALKRENAYFAVDTPNGVKYTRNGSFALDPDGYLVDKQGFAVLSNVASRARIHIPKSSNIEVDAKGIIHARGLANDTLGQSVQLGRIAIVEFTNPAYLKKIGNNLYSVDESNGRKKTTYNELDAPVLAQGFLEKSNVNAVVEMTNLIETNRMVDMYSKVMKTYMEELNNDAITKLAVRNG